MAECKGCNGTGKYSYFKSLGKYAKSKNKSVNIKSLNFLREPIVKILYKTGAILGILLVTLLNSSNITSQRRGNNAISNSNVSNRMVGKKINSALTLQEEAEKEARLHWSRTLKKCGDSYYFKPENYGAYEEAKEIKSIKIILFRYYPPKQLTEADKLNNVDAQPIEALAVSEVVFTAGHCKGCAWEDNYKATISLRKIKGQWNITGAYKPIACVNNQPKTGRFDVDIDNYCKNKFGNYAEATLLGKYNAFSWRCKIINQDGNFIYEELDMNEACRLQHGDGFSANIIDRSKPYNWFCFD